nr:hypothetical protein [Tanacetum cinerariifolium]
PRWDNDRGSFGAAPDSVEEEDEQYGDTVHLEGSIWFGTDGYDNVMMAMSVKELLDWIIDLGGSYHITYIRDYLVNLEEQNGEHPSDTKVFTMKMEILLEPTSNKLLVGAQDNDVDKDVDEQSVQGLALNVDNVFQADDCDAFYSDVDKAPTA